METQKNQKIIPNKHEILTIPVRVIYKNNYPAIELRRILTDIDLIKNVVTAAFHEEPLILIPKFTDKLKSLTSLKEKGILYLDKENVYRFTIKEKEN